MTTAKLLIVEDDGILAANLEAVITELGYGVLGPVSTGEEALLARLGWQPPDRDHDDPELMPANWWVPRIAGDWPALVELLSATAIVALGFDERFPVSVHTFGCDRPCRACSWPDAFPHTDREEPDE